ARSRVGAVHALPSARIHLVDANTATFVPVAVGVAEGTNSHPQVAALIEQGGRIDDAVVGGRNDDIEHHALICPRSGRACRGSDAEHRVFLSAPTDVARI